MCLHDLTLTSRPDAQEMEPLVETLTVQTRQVELDRDEQKAKVVVMAEQAAALVTCNEELSAEV